MDLVKTLRGYLGIEALIGTLALIIVSGFVFLAYLFFYDDLGSFGQGLIVETGGFALDILLFGVVMVFLKHRWERQGRIRRYIEELDDYHGWDSEEGVRRTRGLVLRMVAEGAGRRIPTRLVLTNADLVHANLRDANLSGADLTDAKLQYARLAKADLTGANLSGAHLDGANLTGATLLGTDLTNTCLESADLRGVTALTQEQLNHAFAEPHYPPKLDNLFYPPPARPDPTPPE